MKLNSLALFALAISLATPAVSADGPVYVVRPQGMMAKSGSVLPNNAFGAGNPVVVPSNPNPAPVPDPLVSYTSANYDYPEFSGVAVRSRQVTEAPDQDGRRVVRFDMSGFMTNGTQTLPMYHNAMCDAGTDPAHPKQGELFSTLASDEGRFAVFHVYKPGTYKLAVSCWFDDGRSGSAYIWRQAKVRLNLDVQ